MNTKGMLWTKLTLIALLALAAVVFALPQYPATFPAVSFLKSIPYRLGLDLQGGAHLVYQADTSRVQEQDKESAINGVRDVIERRINAFGVSEPLVQTNQAGEAYRVIVEMAGVFDVQEAIRQIGETPLLEFKTQNPTTTAALTPDEQQRLDDDNEAARVKAHEALQKARDPQADFAALAKEYSEDQGSKEQGGSLGWAREGMFVPEFEKAIFQDLKKGEITKEPVQSQFGYHIIKKIDERALDVAKGEPDKEVLSSHMLFRTKTAADVHPPAEAWVNTNLSGKQLKRASVQFNQQTGEPHVSLEFNDEGAELFAKLTGEHVGEQIAIFLDGSVISAPTVQEKIEGGQAVITGNFTLKDSKELAQRLNAGALPVPITLIAQTTVGPTLGVASLQQSLKAGLIGILVVVFFMIFYYRVPGLIATVALLVYAAFVLTVFKLMSVTLTLAGIAGFILSVGMAVDANVLIFERLKEELRAGKELTAAVDEGFKRAWTSIRDSNISSLITAGILTWFGSSVIKGFAITLGIGILVSMFTAITVSRLFLHAVTLTRVRRFVRLFAHVKKQ